jgi:sugar/nucleoside kinase (ribokinase family)
VNKIWDVLGLGCTTVDELLYVNAYPPADTKVLVDRRERQCGGLTATALVAASRQGASCAYGGALGDNEDSAFVIAALRHEGIDVSTIAHHPLAGPIHSTIIVDQTSHTRSIFFQRPQIIGPIEAAPTEEQIRSARVLFVDHYGGLATVRAQELARKAGVPVVADLERDNVPAFAEILHLCDHLIISERFAAHLSGHPDPASAAAALLSVERQVVIVTCGRDGCWAIAQGEPRPRQYPAFPAEVVDTTGCGDTFHGVYAADLARGVELPRRIRRASAAAALKAAHHGAQKGIPTRAAVEAFMQEQSDEVVSR